MSELHVVTVPFELTAERIKEIFSADETTKKLWEELKGKPGFFELFLGESQTIEIAIQKVIIRKAMKYTEIVDGTSFEENIKWVIKEMMNDVIRV